MDIHSDRLCLAVLDRPTLSALADGRQARKFNYPSWWPDEADQLHVKLWLERAESEDPPPIIWGPRGIVLDGNLIGHTGFHQPPTTIKQALADPTFEGTMERASGGVVEIGYTVFRQHRGSGYASEAVAALIDWAHRTDEVSTVLATVAPANRPSIAVLEAVDGFRKIGSCQGEHGQRHRVYRKDL